MSEEIIQSDYEACDELLRVGGSRNTFIEANCERIDTWRKFADLGEPRGHVLYGLCFFYGHGVDEDHVIAAQWFQKAAEQGDAQGEFSIGQSYLMGMGVEEDHEKAVEWFTKTAEQGNGLGQYNLGYCYSCGQGVEEDQEKAVEWYTKSAEQGNAEGQFNLGRCYLNGQGVEEDDNKAVEWFTKSAEQGHEKAEQYLPKLLTKEIAEQLLADENSVSTWEFTTIEDEAAEKLRQHEGDLDLSGLTELSDEAAKSLAMHQGKLQLKSLKSLSEVAANVLVELVHPAVDGAQILAKVVQFPEFEKGLFNHENQARIARVNSIQTLLSDIDQLIYECGCDHRDETAAELQQALIKFAYRYEVAGNGGRITKEIANSLISCFEYMGGSEVLEEILQWNVEFDEEARSILENYEGEY
jgi:TPR repeat protein